MAIEKMAINKEKEQEKLANDLFNEFSASKGVLFTQPGMFDKIKKEAYLDFVKTFDMQCSSAKDKKARIEENKNAFLSKLNKSAGNELGISNIKFIVEITQKEKEKWAKLTPEEILKETLEAPVMENIETSGKVVAKPKEEKAAEVDFSTVLDRKTLEEKYNETADTLYARYNDRFPKNTREDYYNYLKAFGITDMADFRKSLGEPKMIGEIKELTAKELAKQRSEIVAKKEEKSDKDSAGTK